MINYRNLIRKYIDHVSDLEGGTFLMNAYRHRSSVDFTNDEWLELQRLNRAEVECDGESPIGQSEG